MDDLGISENDHLESQDKKLRLEKGVEGFQVLGVVDLEVQAKGLDGEDLLLVGGVKQQLGVPVAQGSEHGHGQQLEELVEQVNLGCEQEQVGLDGVLGGKLGDTGQQDGHLGDLDPRVQEMLEEDGDGADQLKESLSSLDLSSVASVGEGPLDTPRSSGDAAANSISFILSIQYHLF